MKTKVQTILVWWYLSKVHIVKEGSRTKCGHLYRFDRGGGIVSQHWGLRFGGLTNKIFPRNIKGCKRCAMHLPAGYDF